MTRHTDTHRPAPAARRVTGTPAVAAIALAAACVLAACGPDDPTDQVAAAPMEITKTTTTVTTTSRPITAATVIPAKPTPVVSQPTPQLVQVADRSERVAPPRAVYGQVSAIEPITQTPKTSGTGAVVGGVLGAVLGNQVGSGSGRAAATVLGGVGGAVVGNKVEKHRGETVVGYRVHVQLDNGSSRSFERTNLGNLDVGDRVRVDGGRLREV